MQEKKMLNITLKIPSHLIGDLEAYFEGKGWYVDSKIVPDTKELYDKSSTFRRLVKNVKEAQLERDRFINKNNI